MKKENKIVWLDIPVKNLLRAANFYSHLMGVEFVIEELDDIEFALCPHKDGEAAFCLVQDSELKACESGLSYPMIYLNLDGKLDESLTEVEKYHGKILSPKEKIGEHGYRAIILDSEGNKIALHSYS